MAGPVGCQWQAPETLGLASKASDSGIVALMNSPPAGPWPQPLAWWNHNPDNSLWS